MQKRIKKIQERDFKYLILRNIVVFFLHIFYRKIIVRGQENVPKNEPIIFAPNHKNALMDPLLILSALPKKSVVFMARGDIFINQSVSGFLRFLKILPVFRMRDGIGNLGKNEAPFMEAIDVLKDSKYLCLMPEGQQVEERRLLPLVKGLFRIGFQAQEKYGNNKGVKIVPVGIEYEDLYQSGRKVLLQFGKPIELADYYDLYTQHQPIAYNKLRVDLYEKISELMINVRSTEFYADIYLATLLKEDAEFKRQNIADNEWNRLEIRQKLVYQYAEMTKTDPKKMMMLHEKMKMLYASGKDDDEIARLMKKIKATDWLKILFFSPLFLIGFLFLFIPYSFVKAFIKMGFKDRGFYTSVSFVLGITLSTISFLVGFFFLCFLMPVLYSSLICFVIAPLSGIIAFRLKNLYVDTFMRLLFRSKRKGFTKQLSHFL